jgi:hypothetical protein
MASLLPRAHRRFATINIMTDSIRILFYVEQGYAFDILRPLQDFAQSKGHQVQWLILENASINSLKPGEIAAANIKEAIDYQPHAVVASGDRVPGFIPGLKVQVFHGLNEDKRGKDCPERGLFDLYCTTDSGRTQTLRLLEEQRSYFQVRETGWLKLDTILNFKSDHINYQRPQILYASTFTPRLSSAEILFPEISRLASTDSYQWLVTLHPKMAPETDAKYRSLEGDNLQFFNSDRVVELLHRADIMVCDNSSILQEFLTLKKPVVTFDNRSPQSCMINITNPDELSNAIIKALHPAENLQKEIDNYGPSVTPYLDGASSARVLNAILDMLRKDWRNKKPRNFWRNLKMRRQLKYFGI